MTVNVTPERFAKGMTYAEYVRYIGTSENLAREATGGAARRDFSAFFAAAYDKVRLSDDQLEALKWIAAQPKGPANLLIISEDWSSDCRRDVPVLARLGDAMGLEVRIFRRDGQHFSGSHNPTLQEAPDSNADLMAQFLNHKNGDTWQSIPVGAFFTRDFDYLYHYQEYPAIYHKDRLRERMSAPKAGETPEQTRERYNREFQALQDSVFFRVWQSAAVDEIISALHRRLVLGPV